jgi:small nuclear ribonucleoprotein (snRNP)-like protein
MLYLWSNMLLCLNLFIQIIVLLKTRNGKAYVGLVPLAEGGSVDLDDGTLDQSVRLDELVVGSVVNLDRQIKICLNTKVESKLTTPMILVFRVTCSEPQAKVIAP